MDVKLFGFSISLNLIILIAILYVIMTVNAITCACNEGFIEERKGRKRRLRKIGRSGISRMNRYSNNNNTVPYFIKKRSFKI